MVASLDTVRVAASYRRHGLEWTVGAMNWHLAPAAPTTEAEEAEEASESPPVVFEAAWLLNVCRLVNGRQTCLFESLAVCAGLQALGREAAVVFGYAKSADPSITTPVHAWVSVGDRPVVGPSKIRYWFHEFARYDGTGEN